MPTRPCEIVWRCDVSARVMPCETRQELNYIAGILRTSIQGYPLLWWDEDPIARSKVTRRRLAGNPILVLNSDEPSIRRIHAECFHCKRAAICLAFPMPEAEPLEPVCLDCLRALVKKYGHNAVGRHPLPMEIENTPEADPNEWGQNDNWDNE